MKITLAAKSTADRDNLTPSSERLVNCYAYPAPEGAKAPLVIRSVPGLRDFTAVPGPFIRAMERVEGELYVIAKGALYRVPDQGAPVWLADVPDDPRTTLGGHRSAVTITVDDKYFVWDAATGLTQPTGGTIAKVGSAAFLNQFTLLGDRDGRLVEWTAVGTPKTRVALNFASAEAQDDNIVRIMSAGPYLTVFKEQSTEVWGSTGLGGSSAFIRVQGEVFERGLLGFNLVCWTPVGLFGVATDKQAYLSGSPVSPPNVTEALTRGEPTHCFYYEDRGHQFCVIRFGDRPAWVFDVSTGMWHERSTGVEHGPWDIICSAFCYGQWHLGGRTGRIRRLGLVPYDGAKPLRRTIVSRNLFNGGDKFSVALLEVEGLFGKYDVEEVAPNWLTDQNGLVVTDATGQWIEASEQGPINTMKRAGKVWARFSKDGGHTYSTPRIRTIGRVGYYGAVCQWRALGQFEDMTVELNLTDPVDVPILSEATVEVT